MSTEKDDQDGIIKTPMKGSVKRVSERMAQEMSEKSPTEAGRDDVTSSDDEDR
ncbi:MAG: hypothetical protein ACR2KP_16355 [Egibacteraceae bacterium]